MLRAAFPRARFIWTARQPGELIASNLKMWRAMSGRYALWECPPGALENFIEKGQSACSDALEQCLEEMPRESMLWVDFDELRRDPRRLLERVIEFLDPRDDRAMRRSIGGALDRVKIHPGGSTSAAPTPESARLAVRMSAARKAFSRIA